MNNNVRPMFSIIVPTYNTSRNKFKLMFESVLRQPKFLYELIIVDDGSENEYAEYIDGYAHECNVKVIHQKNKGLPGARNTGIFNSNGKYLVFVDADDYIDEKFLCKATEYIEEYYPDVIYSRLVWAKIKDGEIIQLNNNNCENQDKIAVNMSTKQNTKMPDFYDGKDKIAEIKAKLLHSENNDYIILGSACGAVYKADIVKRYPFDESIKICEDQVFNRNIVNHVKNCLVVPDTWYYYVQYPSSMIHDQKKQINVEKIFTYWDKIREVDMRENEFVATISNQHNINLFCDEMRNLSISGMKYYECKDKILKLYNHEIVQRAIKDRLYCYGRKQLFKNFCVKNKYLHLLFIFYRWRNSNGT